MVLTRPSRRSRRPPGPLVRLVAAFVRSRSAGGMLVGGMFLITVMSAGGAAMTNYAWREAQWAELDAATRAAVSAAGPRLAAAGTDTGEVQERIAQFLGALLPGREVGEDDVKVSYDAESDITTITVGGTYVFDDLWARWGGGAPENVATVVRVTLENERYEVALALDTSRSMRTALPDGVRKLDALKTAVREIATVMDDASATTPGSMMVSIVPYASAVNVADTCNPDKNGKCQAERSAAKERYVRMLAGVQPTMDLTLADAREARRSGTGGHWVDAFHHYGPGTSHGPLRRRFLPADLLDDKDWNLRRTNVRVDIKAQVPAMPTWTVDDRDFWNGCLIARWGAYWNKAARPAGWTQDQSGNWPATSAVAAWSAGAAGLPDTTPLHLSDAAPLASAPHTLFTAYSWPDARISGIADHRIESVMVDMLDPGATLDGKPVAELLTVMDNEWTVHNSGRGATMCPGAAITPLTDDLDVVRAAAAGLRITDAHRSGYSTVGATLLNVGVTWGLRTLSPLWRGVWSVKDTQGAARPGIPCAAGDEGGCTWSLEKSILLVSDGASEPGRPLRGRLMRQLGTANPEWASSPLCESKVAEAWPTYSDAAAQKTAATFNARFQEPHVATDLVDGNSRLNAEGIEKFVDALVSAQHARYDTADRRKAIRDALASAVPPGVAPTPWQLFRGLDAGVADVLVAPASQLRLDGRPVNIGHFCRPTSIYGPYGRADDLIYVGDEGSDDSTPAVPAADVSPFEMASLPPATAGTGAPGTGDFGATGEILAEFRKRADNWFVEACRVAGLRRIRINAIYIGDNTTARGKRNVALMERCVDAAGGKADEDDVFVTPTGKEIADAFKSIFTIRRNLRFVD